MTSIFFFAVFDAPSASLYTISKTLVNKNLYGKISKIFSVTVHLPSTLVYRVLIVPQRISSLYSLTFLNHNKKWFNSDRNRVKITILIFIVVKYNDHNILYILKTLFNVSDIWHCAFERSFNNLKVWLQIVHIVGIYLLWFSDDWIKIEHVINSSSLACQCRLRSIHSDKLNTTVIWYSFN